MSRTKFRYDINGLRALAVVAVVLFHFRVPGFSGGFIGVDVFFVISGFLMTGIIVRGLEQTTGKGFRLFDFYIARARRIIPALFVLCVILMTVGWFYITPDDYAKLGREVDRAMLFISNNYYYKNSGYFDAGSHERMLLHTWSLSVEWQFYMLYPLVLMGLVKLGQKRLPYFIALMLLASFIVSIIKSGQDSSYAFYLLPSRAWEMMVGGLVYYIARSQLLFETRKFLYWPGVLLVFAAIALYDSDTRWPGVPAVLPVLGTALIIFANNSSWSNKNWLAQRLGDWSYSIYLYHWPLVVLLVLIEKQDFTTLSVVLILVSVALGWLSYAAVENPLRKILTRVTNWKVLLVIVFGLVITLLPAHKIRKAKGYLDRIPGEVHEILSSEFDRFDVMYKCHDKRTINSLDCSYGSGEKPLAIVMGDSHAMSIMPVMTDFYSDDNGLILDWSASACPTLEGVSFTENGQLCEALLKERFLTLKEYSEIPVFISNRYSAVFHGINEEGGSKVPNLYFDKVYPDYSDEYKKEFYSAYKQSICKLSRNNPVYMFRPVPELKLHVPKIMGRALFYRGEHVRVSVSREEYEQRNKLANKLLDDVADNCGVKILDLAPYFCDEENCYGDLDGKPVYFDDDHLNTYGASLLRDLLEKNVDRN